jgi:hypothetical protein
LERS